MIFIFNSIRRVTIRTDLNSHSLIPYFGLPRTGTYRRVPAVRDAFEGSFDTNR